MTMSVADKVFLVLALATFVMMFGCIGVSVYLAHTKVELMLKYLKNSPAVTIRQSSVRQGIWGKIFVLGGVTGVLVYSRLYIRHGGVDLKELENFPKALRRVLVFLHWTGIAVILTMLLLVTAAKLGFF